MIQDAAIPAGLLLPTEIQDLQGVLYTAARWTPALLAFLGDRVAVGGEHALAGLTPDDWIEAWGATVSAFRDPESPERRDLDQVLTRGIGAPAASLQAGLDAVLGGVALDTAWRVVTAASPRSEPGGLLLVVLAGNLPGLAVQSLLPALARRRPVIVKSSSVEPLLTPAFVRSLVSRCPALEPAIAAVTWPGGDEGLEAPLLERAATVVAYGGDEAIESIRRRAAGRVLDYGPKISLAVVAADASGPGVAAGLARDVALFDQRGCLSVQAVYTDGDAETLARRLAHALEEIAAELPPGRVTPREAIEAHQFRVEARMRGLALAELDPALGTVVVDPDPELRPSPGRRSVRVHPLEVLAGLPDRLRRWTGRLQGAALAGAAARALEPELRALGVTRCTAPGRLQAPDARWQNGGRDLFEVL